MHPVHYAQQPIQPIGKKYHRKCQVWKLIFYLCMSNSYSNLIKNIYGKPARQEKSV